MISSMNIGPNNRQQPMVCLASTVQFGGIYPDLLSDQAAERAYLHTSVFGHV